MRYYSKVSMFLFIVIVLVVYGDCEAKDRNAYSSLLGIIKQEQILGLSYWDIWDKIPSETFLCIVAWSRKEEDPSRGKKIVLNYSI